jgi:hypothetical protein
LDAFIGGGADQVVMVVVVDGGQEVLTAGECLFGVDLGAEPGVGGSGVALEHLDAQVPILDGAGDCPSRLPGDEPGQCSAELSGVQVERSAGDFRDAVPQAVLGAKIIDPPAELVELPIRRSRGQGCVG